MSITAVSVGKNNTSLSDFFINQSSVPYFSSLKRCCLVFRLRQGNIAYTLLALVEINHKAFP